MIGDFMKYVVVCGVVAVTAHMLMGCSQTNRTGKGITIQADPEGMQAYADLLVGVIRTGKENEKAKNQYFAHREVQERAKVEAKAQSVGFWQRLTN